MVLLVTLLGGVAMSAVAAARRTQSSYPTYLASTNPSDLTDAVAVPDPVSGTPDFDGSQVTTLGHLPYVRHASTLVGFNNVLTLAPNGTPASGIGAARGGPQPLLLGSLDGEDFTQDRVTVVAGRMADPSRPDEVVMTTAAADEFHLHVGARANLGFYTNAQGNDPSYGTAALLPHRSITVHLVGLVTASESVIQDDTERATTFILFTPALTRPLASCCGSYARIGLQLSGGAATVPKVEAEAVRAFPGLPPTFYVAADTEAKAEQSIKPESIALAVFGGIAALAALLIAGLEIGRQLRTTSDQERTLRAIGASPAMTLIDAAGGLIGSVTVGALLAALLAVALSPIAPIGAARAVYPTPGIAPDWTVLGLGVLILIVVLSAVAIGLAHRQAPGRIMGRQNRVSVSKSPLVGLAASAGMPPPAVVGIGFAVESGGSPGAVPVRSAAVGAALALTIVVATVVFGSSLDALVSRPPLYGWNWDYALNSSFGGSSGIPHAQASEVLARDRFVDGWAQVFYGTAQIDGQALPVLGMAPGDPVAPPLLSGHGLERPGQVVLGASTLASIHKHVGDLVGVRIAAGKAVKLRVVGTATLPTIGASGGLHTTMGSGALLTDTLVENDNINGADPNVIFVRFKAGVDRAAALRSLRGVAAGLDSQNGPVSVLAVQRPAEIVNYRSMGTTPLYLGAGLAIGAVVALALTLVTTVRRRRRDLALLKTIGYSRRQLGATIAWQSSLVVLIGVVVGVPLGIVLGRSLWIAFAQEIRVVPAPSVPGATLLLIALGAIVLANVVAALPGRIAASTPTATLLRAD